MAIIVSFDNLLEVKRIAKLFEDCLREYPELYNKSERLCFTNNLIKFRRIIAVNEERRKENRHYERQQQFED